MTSIDLGLEHSASAYSICSTDRVSPCGMSVRRTSCQNVRRRHSGPSGRRRPSTSDADGSGGAEPAGRPAPAVRAVTVRQLSGRYRTVGVRQRRVYVNAFDFDSNGRTPTTQ